MAEQSVEFQQWDGKIQAAEKRDAAIQLIHKDVEEIAEVFQSMKGLLEEQAPNIEILEQNCKETNYNVKLAGQGSIGLRTYSKQKERKVYDPCLFLSCWSIV